jgi:hypothetical protein
MMGISRYWVVFRSRSGYVPGLVGRVVKPIHLVRHVVDCIVLAFWTALGIRLHHEVGMFPQPY